jgi:hypothetical protein
VPSVGRGSHRYTAHYSGDGTYASLDFGTVRVTARERQRD